MTLLDDLPQFDTVCAKVGFGEPLNSLETLIYNFSPLGREEAAFRRMLVAVIAEAMAHAAAGTKPEPSADDLFSPTIKTVSWRMSMKPKPTD